MLYTFGPAGGVGGDYYEALPPVDGGNWWISRVVGRYGNRIDEIQIFWSNGIKEVPSGQFGNPNGGTDGFDFNIRVDKSANYLTEIRGSVGNYNDSVRLFSIQFFTQNGRHSDVYGTAPPGTMPFTFQCTPDFQILGIFGHAENEVDALGVYLSPI